MDKPTTDAQTSLINNFLLIGKLEGYSYLALLFIAMPLKYLTHLPIAVRIAGSIHGALFVAFVIIILMVVRKKQLTTENAMYAFLLSLIPFGTFFLKKLL
jgi:integral membrane protein